MTEFKFYNWLDPGTKDTKIWIEKDGFKPSSRLTRLWSAGRYTSHSELTRQKLKDRISAKN